MTATPHPGQWRLDRVELVNWGTFDGFHAVDVARRGFLLTGHSGSGKSSLVDAVAAVLTPRGRLRFNAAAADLGSRAQDRTMASYVRGAWSRQTDESSGEVVSRYLRPGATWSGILLRYADGTDREPVHLIKLFHMRRSATTAAEVSELHVLTAVPVGLLEPQPFAANGLEMRRVKAAYPDATVTERHAVFAARFQRVLGIEGDNALELLHRTQAAKNLGSLDELFRGYMLDEPEAFRIAQTAVEQFAELSQAHASVVEARAQVEHLTPLVALSEAYDEAEVAALRATELDEALPAVSGAWRKQLAQEEHAATSQELEVAAGVWQAARADRSRADVAVSDARALVSSTGGAAADRAADAVGVAESALRRVRASRAEMTAELEAVGVDMAATRTEWAELRALAGRERSAVAAGDGARTSRLSAVYGADAEARREVERLETQVKELGLVRSNLDPALLRARQLICASTGLGPGELPFVGELVQVRPSDVDWTGAIERALRPLAVVMLVSAPSRDLVVRAVDEHHLGARLLIEVVATSDTIAPRALRDDRSLVRKVEVHAGPFAAWIEAALASGYDLPCVEHVNDLRGLDRGLTRAGQVKRGPHRFEKDDRFTVADRSRWILGWDNQEKIEHLIGLLRVAREAARAAATEAADAQSSSDGEIRRGQALRLVEARAWEDLDEHGASQAVEAARRAHARLLAGSADLREAQRLLEAAQQEAKEAASLEDSTSEAAAGLRARVATLRSTLDSLAGVGDAHVPQDLRDELRRRYHERRRAVTSASLAEDDLAVSKALRAEQAEAQNRQAEAERRIVRLQEGFRGSWPALVADLTVEVDDRNGYRAVLERLRGDRLPEFEHRFFDLLGTQSQRNVAQLRQMVVRALAEIREKIEPVNASLRRSPFDTGRYLRIHPAEHRTPAVQEFLADLRAISDGSWSPEDRDAAEQRFAVMSQLMSRLQSSDAADRAWRTQCLDTRRHVTFIGQEVDDAGAVLNVHDSAAGLSGGQRQKLVVFCLAAALRYQLAGPDAETPRYGTVVLDEAFDKADSRFAGMAMDVFQEFGFHMVLATPLKLLQTLEQYVGGIGLVTCQEFQRSHVGLVEVRDGGLREHEDRG